MPPIPLPLNYADMVCVVSTFDESINELGIGKQIYNIIIILPKKQAGSMSSTEIEVKKVG